MNVATTHRGVPPVLGGMVGQPQALAVLAPSVSAPVHAYLFSGPPGSGKRDAARRFAAALVCPDGGCGSCVSCGEVLAGRHPDVTVVERRGAAISVDEARAVATLAQRSARQSPRQVIVLADFHLVDEAAPALLKTIEEPPPGTVFVVLADGTPPTLATIASRCVPVEFRPFTEGVLEELLVAEGIPSEFAGPAAAGAAGRLDRARLLAGDPGFAVRQGRWRAVPDRMDGTGATVAVLASELVDAADELVEVLRQRQAAETDAAAEAATAAGERAIPGRQAMEERHRREQRRLRTDELRAGLATLAGAYRTRLVGSSGRRALAGALSCCAVIDEAAEALVRNPNETLLLQGLLLALDEAERG
ncbi:MAG: holB [Acidimicrobiaceae bacterium]|nr:holB [Acidimicrobiaceae bacterium]